MVIRVDQAMTVHQVKQANEVQWAQKAVQDELAPWVPQAQKVHEVSSVHQA